MQLWNDYEGRTVADIYPLGKLLRPEGRSAFFSTTNGTGTPSVIRLIEAHFDESEILHRWRTISELDQPNLVTLRKYGETVLDGTPLVYAVMEPTEASLADVLSYRTLTIDETRQLAVSLVDALEALHSRNLVHEHILPENILAAGETVKLRSDCIREINAGLDLETLEDPAKLAKEESARKSRDVRDLAVILLQAYTGHRTLQGSATVLPTPFDAIIRNGISGTWGLAQMSAALAPFRPAPAPKPALEKKAESAEAAKPETASAATTSKSADAKSPEAALSTKAPEKSTEASTAATEAGKTGTLPLFSAGATAAASATTYAPRAGSPNRPAVTIPAGASPSEVAASIASRPTLAVPPDVRDRIVKPVTTDPRRNRMVLIGVMGALLLALLLWYFLRPESTAPAKTADQSISTPASSTPVSASQPATPANTTPQPPATEPSPATTGKWHVVAYTYNHEDQAQQKAATILSHNPDLHAQVFSPSGHAPYLVALGGAMSHDEAAHLRQQAIHSGLPRDTYIQNYR